MNPPPMELQVGPVPTNLNVGDAMVPTPAGMKKFVTMQFTTPLGVQVFFLNAEAIPQICDVMKAKASGLVIPTTGSVLS